MTTPTEGALFPALFDPANASTLRYGDETLTARDLAAAAAGLATRLEGVGRIAVPATPDLDTVVAVVGGLAAGTEVVLIDPHAGLRELEHVLADSAPDLVIAAPTADLPAPLASRARVSPRGDAAAYDERCADDPERTALIVYTSGTTGLPKGVRTPRRALSSNLDTLARAWGWTADDRVAHALPLFHVHGLVIGTLGPLRVGCSVDHLGRFSPEVVAAGLQAGATMFFAVPTMYHRLADACEDDGSLAEALSGARLLVSGSAALPAIEHKRIERLTGQQIVERYGMSETLMNASARADGARRPGTVGQPLDGIELRLLDDDGNILAASDGETIGEIAIRGPNVFTGYLNNPEATAASFRDGRFLTGDLATRSDDGFIRIVGRRSTDLIKSGGYRIGAGEVEGALLEHPDVREVAVTGEPDDDLGERVVAWVVLRESAHTSAAELIAHSGGYLASHKRPRDIRFVSQLPRNAMGKVLKSALRADRVA